MWILVLQRLAIEIVLDVLYFPLWWYTGGAKRASLVCWHFIADANLHLSPWLWLKNLFVPMFGQRDWQGRILSFFVRLVNVILRSFLLAVLSLIFLFLLCIWLLLPLFVVRMFWRAFI